MMNQLLKTALVLALTASFAANVNAGTAAATYDYATGELILEIGDKVAIVGFETSSLFDTAATAPKAGSADAAQFDSKVLAFFTTDAVGLPQGTFSLGNVLPAGLSADDIKFGYSPVGEDNIPTAVTFLNVNVPEPSTMILLGLGAIGFVSKRRRA